ncbi:alpha/beta hydrolase [Micromonospora echinospora]|uniref:Pimeloyl-ACP methyl ester carboxylesterase n=1 Tax=Micromonospora echinospora TaxID=1877 RepID=A0A1C4ZEE5_MICEC|nr:alpha/beta fold hydrolase [Micromonospora echinospora]OZV80396.1 alpha/beta hydrolase [Micromonospora echinospora]SCF31319.1 Pimeloyl-ACP methyl ester carboxylesterase [Micromonospora echinospora]
MTATWLTVAGRRVRYRVDGAGPPVVLLHGISRSLDDWTEQHHLLRDRFRVHSLDLPGYGHSAPLSVPHTLPALADAVAGFCDAVGIAGPAHLAGNSLGGAVAMQLAVRDPARVSSLVLVNSAGFGREVALALRILAIRPLGRVLLRPNRLTARRVTRSLFHDPVHATEARVAHALAMAREPHAARVMLETLRSLGGLRGVHPQWRADLLDAVAALPLPVLVTWGDRDLILPVTHLTAARARLPHARTHLFTGCGHLPQVECAEEFSRVVADFWTTPG